MTYTSKNYNNNNSYTSNNNNCVVHASQNFCVKLFLCFAAGLEQKMESLSDLKVKGLVLGPIHKAEANQPQSLDFTEIEPDLGNLEKFRGLIKTAHKKGEPIYCCVNLFNNHTQ